jgi:glyoxylase-like metal-dependent hydrolase (beta-lactamase superfamily II)
MTSPERVEAMKRSDPDSVWLLAHPSYPPNPPTRTFTDELTLRVGSHKFHCIHLPGHTSPQTAVHVPEEGVLFTGDNVFCRSKTFIQEADPWDWLAALHWIERLDVEVIVPGHGEPCDRGYVAEQARILERWLDAVQRMVDRGLTVDEAVREPLDVPAIDPYPLGQRLFATFPHLDELNVRNLHARIVARGHVTGTIPLLVVDAANVVGMVPDGWWLRRAEAAELLRDALAPVAERGLSDLQGPLEVVLVVEGRAARVSGSATVRVVAAPGNGDDAIVDLVADAGAGRRRVVATADRGLGARVVALGAAVLPPSALPARASLR